MPETIKWENTTFTIYDFDNTEWPESPGVYMFVGVTRADEWYPLYVGRTITDTLADRLADHDRYAEAERRGAETIHVAVLRSDQNRRNLEADLIEAYRPLMNKQKPSRY